MRVDVDSRDVHKLLGLGLGGRSERALDGRFDACHHLLHRRAAGFSVPSHRNQGYLAHMKMHPPRTLQQDYA